MDFNSVLQLIISGISLGSVYALISVGIAIVYSNLRFSNLAHGGMISACAYIGFFFQNAFETPPPFAVTLIFTALCGVALSLFIDTVGYRRIRQKNAPKLYYFLISAAVAILIEQILNIYFGRNSYAFPAIFESTTFMIGSLRFSSMDMLILGVALLILSVLIFVINKTRIGLAIRVVSINPEASRLMGINSTIVIMTVFAMAGALAGVSGVLLGAKYNVYSGLGQTMITKGMIACCIGGLGSMGGTIIAALILGIVEMFLIYWTGSLVTPIVLFGIMLVFLVIRPNGLAGRFAKEKV